MTAARSKADRAAQSCHAAFAATMARCASSLVPSGMVPITSPVDGLVASNTLPLSESTHLPSMCIFNSSTPLTAHRP